MTTTTGGEGNNTYTYVLKNSSSQKDSKRHLAKFPADRQMNVDFKNWAKPVKMTQEVIGGKEELPSMPIVNMETKKSHRRKQLERFYDKKKSLEKNTNQKTQRIFHLEDGDATYGYDGKLEGGQQANYALFMMEGSEFKVYNVDEWYNFKPKQNHKIMSLEEAEIAWHKQSHQLKMRWEKFNKAGDPEDTNVKKEEIDDIHDNNEEFSILGLRDRSMRKKKAIKEEVEEDVYKNGDEEEESADKEEKEEEPDLGEGDAGFSDDEEIVQDVEEEDEKKNDGEEEELNDAGKEINKILKNRKREEGEMGSESDDEDEEEVNEYEISDEESEPKTKTPKNDHVNKKPKIELTAEQIAENSASTLSTGASKDAVTEEEVRKALLLAGKIKSKLLVKKFKSRLPDQSQKSRFIKMVQKLGMVIEDAGEKYLVLRDEYKAGLRVPK
eukprot:TRINITY_DN10123_c105_g1_i1.p1 TRINITY_DN10123_c105_g1~~TRINITY_DN10123_c105_g1_i1.p1  ORF type:complete len:440 (-),score=174.32 TRINITY_DN10123_c105_g1_i1:35-1354(-)